MVEKNVIEWLGKLPSHWDTSRINGVYELRVQKVSDNDYPPLSVTKQGILPQLETVAKTNAHDDRKLLRKGDFAINSRSDRRGSCGISDYDGSVSLINTVMKPREEMCPKYYNWLFHTTQFADEFYKWGHGIVDDLWTTNWQDMKKITIPLPPLKEQNKIADFLDEKCAEIDSISAEIQEQINTLEEYKKSVITEAVTKGLNPNVKMKDSGIEWIGEIPNDWEVKKLKYFCDTRNEKYFPSMGQLDYLGLENIVSWHCKSILSENEYDLEGSNLCYKNDVVFGKLRPYLAKVYLVDYNRCCSSEFAIFCNFNGSARFYKYLLVSHGFVNTVDNSTYGIKMPRANIEFIKNVYVPHPKAEEQEIIANFLDSMCIEIDSAIEDKQKQLEILDDYKKTLIYEYVTGKKEVI